MSEMETRRQRSRKFINDALPYLDEEQTIAFANAIAGAAMTNQMVAQMRSAKTPVLNRELMHISAAGVSVV